MKNKVFKRRGAYCEVLVVSGTNFLAQYKKTIDIVSREKANANAISKNFMMGGGDLKTLFFRDEKSERTGMYSQRVFKTPPPIMKFPTEATERLHKLH